MGLTLLEELDALIAINEASYRAYAREIESVPGLHVMEYPAGGRYNYQHVVMMVDEDEAGLVRDDVVAVLRAENVLARRYFYPGCHRMKPYAAMHEYASINLPVTDDIAARVIVMPTGPQLTDDSISLIGAILRRAVDSGPRIAHT
jgi:dTDP-4-amino-4,6-dideoxygalactose transaminase